MRQQSYGSGTAFRIALETRLQDRAVSEGTDLQRLRRRVAFDRLLTRLALQDRERWALKGGYALEIQLAVARSTRDLDLVVKTLPEDAPLLAPIGSAAAFLKASAVVDAHDYFAFAVGNPIMEMEGLPYGGARFPVESRVGGRPFVTFHVDVAVGDTIVLPLQTVALGDWLGFAGIAAGSVPVLSREQQFAEKMHAYTAPRDSDHPNSRVKDLVDMVLLLDGDMLDTATTVDALITVFRRRGRLGLPPGVRDPPGSWTVPFATMAHECGISSDIELAMETVRAFYAQVLSELPPA